MGRKKNDAAFAIVSFEGEPDEVNAQWRAHRKMGLGGSDAGAVLGLNPWRSPLEVWLEKTGREDSPDLSGKPSVEWGNRLEPKVAEKFAENHPEFTVERPEWCAVSKEHPWMFASLDGILRTVGDGGEVIHGVLEVKTSGRDTEWKDGVPAHYACQVAHYLAVTGWQFAYVAVLIGGQDYREYRIERDEDDVRALVESESRFWREFVTADVPPAITGNGDEGAAIARMYPESDGETGIADDMAETLAAEYDALCKQEKEIRERKDKTASMLKAIVKDKKALESENVKVTWVRTHGFRFNQKRFQEEMPEEYARFQDPYSRDGGIRVTIKGA